MPILYSIQLLSYNSFIYSREDALIEDYHRKILNFQLIR